MPEPMCFPHSVHLFNGHALRLRDEEVDEQRHYDHESSKEKEQAKLQVAKQCEEDLANYEGEQHVDRHVD